MPKAKNKLDETLALFRGEQKHTARHIAERLGIPPAVATNRLYALMRKSALNREHAEGVGLVYFRGSAK